VASRADFNLDDGPGARALQAFLDVFGASTSHEAMAMACRRLRTRVQEAGWQPDLTAYVRAFGLRVVEAPISQAGRLDYEDGKYLIRVQSNARGNWSEREIDPNEARGRQRFSIAHELGHALLLETLAGRSDLLMGLRDPGAWEHIERLCDAAAGDLLVPRESMLAGIRRHGLSPGAVEAIAGEFAVSREVVLRNLLSEGARTVVLWRVRHVRGTGLHATVRESYSGPNDPRLWIGTASACFRPNLVHRAARLGRASSRQLKLRRGSATWHLAGVAECDQVLNPEQRTDETEVLMLLLHQGAPTDRHPLWTAALGRLPTSRLS
jgi:Zn-dependent peptidase ImmA (M78 family)